MALRLMDLMLVRTMPAVLGYASMCAVVLGIFDYTGGSLKGVYRDINLDEVSRKEMIRTSRRRPIEEIVADVGESRSK